MEKFWAWSIPAVVLFTSARGAYDVYRVLPGPMPYLVGAANLLLNLIVGYGYARHVGLIKPPRRK